MSDLAVTRLYPEDRDRWTELWRGYLEFYETSLPPGVYDATWRRLLAEEGAIRGIGARIGGSGRPLAGIAHFLFHAHAWSQKDVCYLQDLFVARESRGRGCGRALIEATATVARAHGCHRLYWTTKEDNRAARALYDRVARYNGFIRYDYPLE